MKMDTAIQQTIEQLSAKLWKERISKIGFGDYTSIAFSRPYEEYYNRIPNHKSFSLNLTKAIEKHVFDYNKIKRMISRILDILPDTEWREEQVNGESNAGYPVYSGEGMEGILDYEMYIHYDEYKGPDLDQFPTNIRQCHQIISECLKR